MEECLHKWSGWYGQEDVKYRWRERVCLLCGAIQTKNYTTKK